MRTKALSSPAQARMAMSKIKGESASFTAMGVSARYCRMAACSPSPMEESTSSSRAGSPAAMPAAAAAGMPRSPPVLGTNTLFTFLMMFPLASTSMRWAGRPKVWRATAAA